MGRQMCLPVQSDHTVGRRAGGRAGEQDRQAGQHNVMLTAD